MTSRAWRNARGVPAAPNAGGFSSPLDARCASAARSASRAAAAGRGLTRRRARPGCTAARRRRAPRPSQRRGGCGRDEDAQARVIRERGAERADAVARLGSDAARVDAAQRILRQVQAVESRVAAQAVGEHRAPRAEAVAGEAEREERAARALQQLGEGAHGVERAAAQPVVREVERCERIIAAERLAYGDGARRALGQRDERVREVEVAQARVRPQCGGELAKGDRVERGGRNATRRARPPSMRGAAAPARARAAGPNGRAAARRRRARRRRGRRAS